MNTATTPHVRLTVSDLKEQYLTGKLTVKGYVYNWILATRKRGWRYRTKIKDFCQELGISRSAFYKAIAELRAEPGSNFYFEIPHGEIEMWVEEASTVTDTASAVMDRMSTIVDTVSSVADTASSVADTASTVVKNKNPKPAQDKASTAPTDLDHLYSDLSHLYSIEGDKNCLNEDKQPTARDGLVDPQPAAETIDVAKILEETKKQLLSVVQRQREERERKNFRGVGGGGCDGGQGGIVYRDKQGPHLESMVATEDATYGGNGMPYPGATVCREQGTEWEEHPGAMATPATPSSHGGHGEHYMWRVRGGGLQPLAGILNGYTRRGAAIIGTDLLSREGSPSRLGDPLPFSEGSMKP